MRVQFRMVKLNHYLLMGRPVPKVAVGSGGPRGTVTQSMRMITSRKWLTPAGGLSLRLLQLAFPDRPC
ncbi:hypothetical protein J6590_002077 [Homalodisca vitripennis]|nr:hypothetical protein J6590_002077 [Homalodisca vitripennis]